MKRTKHLNTNALSDRVLGAPLTQEALRRVSGGDDDDFLKDFYRNFYWNFVHNFDHNFNYNFYKNYYENSGGGWTGRPG